MDFMYKSKLTYKPEFYMAVDESNTEEIETRSIHDNRLTLPVYNTFIAFCADRQLYPHILRTGW